MKGNGLVLNVLQAECGDLCGVLLVEFVRSGKFGKWFTASPVECTDEVVFRESTKNDFRSMVNHIGHTLVAMVYIEKYSALENNSLAVHGEILAMVWVLVSKVKVNSSAWAICTEYRKDVRVLFERDSEDEQVKSGEVSEDSVKWNESKAISFIEYGKCVSVADEGSNDKWIEIKSKIGHRCWSSMWNQIFGGISQHLKLKVNFVMCCRPRLKFYGRF